VASILGPEDQEDEWYHDWEEETEDSPQISSVSETLGGTDSGTSQTDVLLKPNGISRKRILGAVKVVAEEKAKEKHLGSNGDYCGGIGGELGRRLEAWLYTNGLNAEY